MADEGVSPFEVDPGKPFQAGERQDPDEHEQALPPPELTPEGFDFVDEETIRSALQAQGALLHGAVAVDKASDEWVWLQAELDAIAPPLTRICNRYPAAARVVAMVGDPAAVVVTTGGYARRSLAERAAAKARLEMEAEAEAAASPTPPFEFTPET